MIPGLLPAQLGNLYGQYNLAKGITKGADGRKKLWHRFFLSRKNYGPY